MADLTTLKNTIRGAIKRNGTNDITGAVLQAVLISIVDNVESGMSYTNIYNSNVKSITDALDVLMDKTFYTGPAAVNASVTVTPYRNGNAVTTVYDGMNIDSIMYSWSVTNYLDSISEISLGGVNIPVSELNSYNISSSESTPYTYDVTKQLVIKSSYKDTHEVTPADFSKYLTVTFNKKSFCFTSSTDLSLGQIASNASIYAMGDPTLTGSTKNITISGAASYVYFIFPRTASSIHIYEQGGVDPGGTVTTFLGNINVTEYDNPVTYYVYRSINALTGAWTLKY